MEIFYVSLVQDLIGSYLEIKATDKETVRQYLGEKYYRPGHGWALPWCAVYNAEEFKTMPDRENAIIIPANCGKLNREDFDNLSNGSVQAQKVS